MLQLPELSRGDAIREGWLRDLVRKVNSLGNITGEFPVNVQQNASGVRVGLSGKRIVTWWTAYNDANEDIPPFSVAGISGVRETDEGYVLKIVKPSTTFRHFYVIVGPEGIKDDKFGSVTFDPEFAQYDTGTPAFGEQWGAKNGQWTLSKGYYGFNILGNERSSRVLCFPQPIMQVLVKTDAAIDVDDDGTCSIYAGTQGSESDTGINITCFNKFADLATDKWAIAAFMSGGWYLTAGRCA